ncbi:hypothetical protein EJ03DRAFT_155550 [Teratosphaeria nubilosa]|uniref:Uncharacterized protein n=1 Tax=Teratosphaeria nubilosa TaxID=161662 RepID=A0A6G1LKN2_9PEZI|nr:hypothetical protein EJ03DRAFT_155550 [Teratosphaeria nubilosa]
MAAYEIQKHFKGLRVETGSKKGRNPFATGFESDSDEEAQRRSRARERSANSRKQRNIPVSEKPASAPKPSGPVKRSILDQLCEDSDDDFLAAVPRTHRRPSPAPKQGVASLRVSDGASKRRGSSLHSVKAPRAAVALAAGTLAYLDDSSDDESAVASADRRARRPSPGTRKQSDRELSQTRTQPPKHTVASAFAGTKYLQDSESDEEAVSSRKNSAASEDSNTSPSDISGEPLSPYESALAPRHPDVKRVEKPKKLTTNGGSGVSWRAFSASRSEQRNTEIEALQASLRQRGKCIAFGTHALTDDGERIPIPATPDVCTGKNGFARARGRGRGKSPPRRAEDIKPAKDEVDDGPELLRQCQPLTGTYDPNEYRTNLLPDQPIERSTSDTNSKSLTNGDTPIIRIDDISTNR